MPPLFPPPTHRYALTLYTQPFAIHSSIHTAHSFSYAFIYLFVYFLCIPLPISEMSCQVSRQSPQQDNKRTCIHSLLARCARSLPLECKCDWLADMPPAPPLHHHVNITCHTYNYIHTYLHAYEKWKESTCVSLWNYLLQNNKIISKYTSFSCQHFFCTHILNYLHIHMHINIFNKKNASDEYAAEKSCQSCCWLLLLVVDPTMFLLEFQHTANGFAIPSVYFIYNRQLSSGVFGIVCTSVLFKKKKNKQKKQQYLLLSSFVTVANYISICIYVCVWASIEFSQGYTWYEQYS